MKDPKRKEYVRVISYGLLLAVVAFYLMNLSTLTAVILGLAVAFFAYTMKFWFKSFIERFVRLFLKSK